MRTELSMTSRTDDGCQGTRREIVEPLKHFARKRCAMFKRIALATLAMTLAPSAWAYEVVQSHVTIVESSYMPTQVFFQVDIGSPSCPAGTWLRWANATVDGNKAVFSLLLAAVNSGNRIQYFVNDGDTTCQVQFLYAIAY
jgi:hypothetical protein